ncbi:hypothetical protein Hdeb2414_s1137g00984961 [Helianthus debilis subsp. tardiflorus]
MRERETRRRGDDSAIVCGSSVSRPRDRVLIWLRFSFHSQIRFVRFKTRVGSVNKESWFYSIRFRLPAPTSATETVVVLFFVVFSARSLAQRVRVLIQITC